MNDQIISKVLYKGTIRIDFNAGTPEKKKHIYIIYKLEKGVWVKIFEKGYSVTSVTGMMDKPALKFWAVKMMYEHLINWIGNKVEFTISELLPVIEEGKVAHTKFKDQAADMGTQVHDFAEQYILYKLKKIKNNPEVDKKADDRVKNGILAFLQWVDQHKIKFIDSEILIYSKKHGYCGLADCIAEVDGQMTLVDFKTSNYMAIEYYAQVAAYAFADAEESKRKYDRSLIIKFSKETGDFELKERNKKEMAEDYQAFLGLLEVKKWSDKYSVPFVKK